MCQGVVFYVVIDKSRDNSNFGQTKPRCNIFWTILHEKSDGVAFGIAQTEEKICHCIAVVFNLLKSPYFIFKIKHYFVWEFFRCLCKHLWYCQVLPLSFFHQNQQTDHKI